MDFNEFKKIIKQKLKDINVEINEQEALEFYKYMKLLISWNEKINLTAITDENEVIVKHFVDSLTISKYVKKGKLVADIGTGAGFPGIPLAIMNKDIKVNLIDSLNKRINFINEIIKEIEVTNTETIHSRAEDFGKNKENREKYDIATSRAVAKLNVLVEYLLPIVKIGGRCLCMKGPNCEEEIEESKNAVSKLGGEIEKIEKITLDKENERTIIVIKKIKETKAIYPRKAGIPSKEPLM